MPLHFSFSLIYSQWLMICFATLENPLTYYPIQKLTLLSHLIDLDQWGSTNGGTL